MYAKLPVNNNDWTTKSVTIKNKTTRALSTNKVIPTWSAMVRMAGKI
jgi:ribosomal protein L39E